MIVQVVIPLNMTYPNSRQNEGHPLHQDPHGATKEPLHLFASDDEHAFRERSYFTRQAVDDGGDVNDSTE